MTGAERMRRSRQVQQVGAYHVNFIIGQDARMRLIEAGWLRRADRDDKQAITAAVVECLTKALKVSGESETSIKNAAAGHAEAPLLAETATPSRPNRPPLCGLQKALRSPPRCRRIASC